MADQSFTQFLLAGQLRVKFEQYLLKEGVPAKNHTYYRYWANHFIKSADGKNPVHLHADAITALLTNFGRDEKLADWQFAQLICAVNIYLTKCLKIQAAKQVDWQYWKNSARGIAQAHPTTAREYSPGELSYLKSRREDSKHSDIRNQHRKLIVRMVTEIRARGYAYRTEEAYEQWVVRYIDYCKGQSPMDTGADNVTKFLNDLVVTGNVSASTQNQALNALIFLYKQVLRAPLGQLENFSRSKRKKILPVVMSRSEVRALLSELNGWQCDVASLLYGTGMRVMEGLTLRVKDIDFQHGRIHVCQAKGKKDRFVPLPKSSIPHLTHQISKVSSLHKQDLSEGYGETSIPEALSRKYPNATRELKWQFLYPSGKLSVDPRSGAIRRFPALKNKGSDLPISQPRPFVKTYITYYSTTLR